MTEVIAETPSADGPYRERAHLVAFLAALYPATIGQDPAEPEYAVVYVQTPHGQLSWHIAPGDMDLFGHVELDGETIWDGHTTEAKYERLGALTRSLAAAAYGARIARLEEEHSDLVNELLEQAPESWDGDEAAEAIAVSYLRHLERLADDNGLGRGRFDDTAPKPSRIAANLQAARARATELERLAADILASFDNTAGDGYRARVGQVQIAKWRKVLDGER